MKKILYLFIFVAIRPVYCQESAVFQNVFILRENAQSYSYQDVIKSGAKFEEYRPDQDESEQVTYWIKFDYKPKTNTHTEYLYSPFLFYKSVELYYQFDDSICYEKSALSQLFSERNLVISNHNLKVPNKAATCYLHIQGFVGYNFKFILADAKNILSEEISNGIPDLICTGISLLSLLLSLLLLIFLKERLYLYYFLLTLFVSLSRLINNGYFLSFFPFEGREFDIEDIFNLYSFCYAGITISLLLYFRNFLKVNATNPNFSKLIGATVILRLLLWILHISINNENVKDILNSNYIDLIFQMFILVICALSYRQYPKLAIIAFVSISMILFGTIIHTFKIEVFEFSIYSGYRLFLLIGTLDVVFFLIALGYRFDFLKKENEKALHAIIDKIRENEIIKDTINQELEQKVAARTVEIQKLNELLSNYNQELKHEIVDISKARLFSQNMSFKEFQNIFLDNKACLQYLSDLKWKKESNFRCIKCGYNDYKVLENLSRRCSKCSHVESPIAGTLFHNTKFPLTKAFYITYMTTMNQHGKTIEQIAAEIDLRPATCWTFRQKVLSVIEKNKSRKKHKDGWTHLIEYSMEE